MGASKLGVRMDGAEDGIESLVRRGVRAELGDMFDELRRFVDRRIAELSTEVHATVQLVDFSEANLSRQLARIHEQIATVIATPSQAARNSGMELEAVVLATEEAANRIMAAAEAIETWVQEGQSNPAALASVPDKIAAIFEACSFQDLTGQRIRRAIEHLQGVETMLDSLIPPGTTPAPAPAPVVRPGMLAVCPDIAINPDMGQEAIDRLMDF
jgi:chemotaxis protein CheZ